MELEKIMTNEEQQAVDELIAAHLNAQTALLNLAEAKADLKTTQKKLTDLYFWTGEREERISTIPARFVAYFQNEPYLVEVDEEGDSGHRVSRIAGILRK